MISIASRIATEHSISVQQVEKVMELLDDGATVPFIARYRKEATGTLDDGQLRSIEERIQYLQDLEARRSTILKSITEQGKLSSGLEEKILAAETKGRLEDLYLPYKPKRRTKGQIAIEAGLLPLADVLFNDPSLDPEKTAIDYLNEDGGIVAAKDALDGAKYILMERFSEDADLVAKLRQKLYEQASISSYLVEGKEAEAAKFRDYFSHHELLKKTPSHRFLAMLRGRSEGVLRLTIDLVLDEKQSMHPCRIDIAQWFNIVDKHRPADAWLQEVVRWTWQIKLHARLEMDLLSERREFAENEAIKVFAENLKDLLLAAPAGPRATLGLDPGLRTGVKLAVVDATGKFLDEGVIYPHAPKKQWDQSLKILGDLCQKHRVELISIGNGTASRETDQLAADLIKKYPELSLQKIVVSEAGASVYSASKSAALEFPELDVTIRGAVSIARRLQDPLAELVKIEPKAIGVGQYQHDVSQIKLAKSLDAVIEDCVNGVGVDLNMASAPLLSRVSGLNNTIANNIVAFRDANGQFKSREQLKEVSRLGDKVFQLSAGFLRIMNGSNPLDCSAVHPEAYQLASQVAEQLETPLNDLIGDEKKVASLNPKNVVSDLFGIETVRDVCAELAKPGRDPRPEFKAVKFKDDIEKMSDLKEAMILEGVVTNVTNFGAFVDVGVHQDGLVHVSALADKFVKDPREVVKVGDIVKVKVIDVDIARKRIALSMRLGDAAKKMQDEFGQASKNKQPQRVNHAERSANKNTSKNAFALAFESAKNNG